MTKTLTQARLQYEPQLPESLKNLQELELTVWEDDLYNGPVSEKDAREYFSATFQNQVLTTASVAVKEHPPLTVGVVLSGGQAPGGHNVITGLYDALQQLNSGSRLIGFLDGPSGIIDNKSLQLTGEVVDQYRNQGGFDMIGSGRTKIETPEQYQKAEETARAHNLDALVIIGGDDSNTNAGLLAEYFIRRSCSTAVVGVPKTIDGDLKTDLVECSFGFDTATKIYSEFIGNLARDGMSAKKYYFFVKLMGRAASHVALEVALQAHPNVTLISEEIAAKGMTLENVTKQICDVICKRAEEGKNYGVVLIPEGIIEFIPEFRAMIDDINRLLAQGVEASAAVVSAKLDGESYQCFKGLPETIQQQLLLTRDPHGNVQVSKIESERLLIATVTHMLERLQARGRYRGRFNAQPLFCGYEGRSGFPSNFDCAYCYTLGHVAALLAAERTTGYMAAVRNLAQPVKAWQPLAVPIASMIHREERKGKMKPVIRKALVDLEGAPYQYFVSHRDLWAENDNYQYPGPIQFEGDPVITDSVTQTLQLEQLQIVGR